MFVVKKYYFNMIYRLKHSQRISATLLLPWVQAYSAITSKDHEGHEVCQAGFVLFISRTIYWSYTR